jgi:rod shape-determining protein MreC
MIFFLSFPFKKESYHFLENKVYYYSYHWIVFVKKPQNWIHNLTSQLRILWHLDQVKQDLSRHQRSLKSMENEILRLKEENRIFRQAVRALPPSHHRFFSVPFSIINGMVSQSALIPYGAKNGIIVGQVAVTSGQIMGQVVKAYDNTSIVRLITDVQSRTPVVFQKSQIKGILTGSPSGTLHLSHYEGDLLPEIGEAVLSSSVGGLYPTGWRIGTVVKVHNHQVWIKPHVQWEEQGVLHILKGSFYETFIL